MTNKSRQADDLMLINIGLTFQAKLNPEHKDARPLDVCTEWETCLPAEEETAVLLERMAKAIREQRLFGFLQQEAAECSVGAGEWIQRETIYGDGPQAP